MWLASYSEAAFPLVEIRERLQRVGMSDLAQKPGRIRESSARGVFVGLYSFTVCTHASPHYHRRALQPPYFEPWKPLHHFYPPPPHFGQKCVPRATANISFILPSKTTRPFHDVFNNALTWLQGKSTHSKTYQSRELNRPEYSSSQ